MLRANSATVILISGLFAVKLVLTIEQPYEDHVNPQARFKHKITIKAFPVETKAGLLFAYLGPSPAPLADHGCDGARSQHGDRTERHGDL
jgi:hypothetical protein